jgi:HTH-type transcriptional regulator/antitoxin HigA
MDASPGSREADELDVLATLVDRYESERFPIEAPDPIEAITFRMEQAGLSKRDLEPLIGSRARVSEVLSGKRALTLPMIRALHGQLGIPLVSLIGAGAPTSLNPATPQAIDPARLPLEAMAKVGWIPGGRRLRERLDEIVADLVQAAGGLQALPAALFRTSAAARRQAKTDPHALQAWCLKLLAVARSQRLPSSFKPQRVTREFARRLVGLSAAPDGPARARTALAEAGIHLVCLPHLPKTHLDGAAMLLPDGTPVIGMTLRFDRVDNFWFCLAHELAHVALHLGKGETDGFFDDLTLAAHPGKAQAVQELEADAWAEDALIPAALWKASGVAGRPKTETVLRLARDAGVHPAIVAGRVRHVHRNYHLLSRFVGQGEVRRHLLQENAAC